MKRKTEADYHEMANKYGLKWSGNRLPTRVTKTTSWTCIEGHTFNRRYSDLAKNNICPTCKGSTKTKEHYHDLASSKGFMWVGKRLPKNVMGKTKWRCSKKHTWEQTFSEIQRGKGCPYCAATRKKTSEDYLLLTSTHNIKWIGKKLPKNTRQKTKWQCVVNKSHVWETTYEIISNNSPCPFCSGKRVSIDAYKKAGEQLGIQWTGKKLPATINDKTSWKCSNGHFFNTSYKIIVNGHNCSQCVNLRKSKGEQVVTEVLNSLRVNYSREKTFTGCKDKQVLPFDFCVNIQGLTFLIEYNGRQHYESVSFFGGRRNLKEQKRRDKIKEDFARKNGIPLLIIPYWDFDNIENLVKTFLPNF